MNIKNVCNLLLIALALSACAMTSNKENFVKVTIVHMNDIYEILPVSGGREGGLARVASLAKQLKTQNPNTIITLGGDFLSPSAMGTAKIDGQRVAGKQIVEVLNTLGLDYATFGNHEFDLSREQFNARLQEIQFSLISSNVFDENGKPFNKVVNQKIVTFKNLAGDQFKIGLFGVTLDANKKDFVSYSDPIQVAGDQANNLAKNSDFVIGLTHLAIKDDETLVKKYPAINMVLGGHEHDNYQRWRGNHAPILKADGNARSVYVIDLYFYPETHRTAIEPRLVFVNDSMSQDPAVKQVVDQWVEKVFQAFRQQGLDPEAVVSTIDEPLDGLESSVRNSSTNLTRLIANSMLRQYKNAELSIFNAGAIRIDDYLAPGNIVFYDIIRTLPFGGTVSFVEMRGDLLNQVLRQGAANSGTGGFLHWANVQRVNDSWLVNGKDINNAASYNVAIADFLLTGQETGLDFLTLNHPGIKLLEREEKKTDIRQLVADELKSVKGR